MRGLFFILTAIIGSVAAADQCTKDNSASCCQGYTYNDNPLQKRTTVPVCDGTSIDPAPGLTPPTCPTDSSGNTKNPVCTAIKTIPQGSFDGTLYCGNPLANTGSGTVKGTIHVEVGPCQVPATGFCFILTATAPPGTTLDNDFKVQISTSPLTSDNPGQFAVKVSSQPVYYPFSLVYGSTDPCASASQGTVYIGFHTGDGSDTCWAGGNSPTDPPTQTIPGGNSNWALQFSFVFTCKDVCQSWCCCPPPPTIPDCPTDYSQSCPGLCNPSKPGTQCNLIHVANPSGWTTNPDYAQKCCCKPPDTPQCATGLQKHVLDSGVSTCSAFSGVCGNPVLGTIADCSTGNYNGVCCCCTPNQQCSSGTKTDTAGACSGSPPAGQTCTSQSDGCGGQICCCKPSGTCNTQTAFGVPASCSANTVCNTNTLSSKGCGKNRWGWYINVDLSGGATATYKLYAGAGLNDLSKGTDVGSVSVQPCSSGSTQYCAFFSTMGGWVIVDTHVEADCDALSTRTTQNFPCAPGGYNDNGSGTCGSGGLPGTTWQSQPFVACASKKYAVIFHAAVAHSDSNCSPSNCGSADPTS
ncbi:uncharacterized protein N7496_010042 [Penicillium cataractarum]|uniref:Uncharacterized protein n=1 Tax=Penicillium cataractarum TaxID=2100454 RepID=A0A9W9V1J5_9EURO|nr:uncharacterized protein N7496_010042 [Penicillium cataractarum]KAJ5364329.1 hypothetical protein N7496_010042 [Penicillium cataractarum]